MNLGIRDGRDMALVGAPSSRRGLLGLGVYLKYMNIDFSQIPKSLCDSVSMNFTQHHFLLALASGQNVVAFALPPELVKALVAGLTEKVTEYESKFGAIPEGGAESGIQSPIQLQ